jgi:pimeloyl-ACP methyl ester carboxylesterase
LDWGGTGRPLVFLAGLGFTAHDFDEFAPQFTGEHHVYGITRRGFGSSSAPTPTNSNYTADRLADDVLSVINALGLQQPVVVGHSIAGEELSSIGSRYPEKVSGLVYLDAGYSYAYYDSRQGDLILDSIDLKKKMDAFLSASVPDMKEFLGELHTDILRYEMEVRAQREKLALLPPQPPRSSDPPPIFIAISAGRQKYTAIRVPTLAIFADPHSELNSMFPNDPKARATAIENDRAATTAQAEAFKSGITSARVVLLPNASHFVFKSNGADVEREMKLFLKGLQ